MMGTPHPLVASMLLEALACHSAGSFGQWCGNCGSAPGLRRAVYSAYHSLSRQLVQAVPLAEPLGESAEPWAQQAAFVCVRIVDRRR